MMRGMCFGLVVFAAIAVSFVTSHSWSGCTSHSYYIRADYGYIYSCENGWKHNGNRYCIIPICRPTCKNGGTCKSPNVCDCPSTSTGGSCQTLTCSYQRPCYPGDCENYSCKCEPSFYSTNQYDGCININSTAEEFRPEIVQSNVTLAHIRRSDNQTQYMFTVVGKDENNFTLVWSNQKRFNNLRFEFDTLIDIPELPQRPNYVHDAKIGIVASSIEASVSKIPRDGGVNRYIASNKTYNCETGISEDNPAVEKDTCEINDENFATLIEHGDILLLKFRSRSGGFQKLVNIDNQGQSYETKHYNGLYGKENLEFRFDFVAPDTAEEFRPEIVQSNVTLAHIRRSDNQTQYMFTVVGKDENNFTLVWSNQKRFNNLRFEFDTLIDIPELPQRPNYVHDAKIGIVASSIEASVSKIPRDGGVNRYIASNKTYNCETGISEDNPAVEKDTCEINDENFATLIEHGDILLLKFRSRSGGFQKLVNIDNQGQSYETKHYNGLYGKENHTCSFVQFSAICRPTCKNGGTCKSPNVCDCPSTSTGGSCQTLTCSYQRPCYPGDCENYSCKCEPSFYSTNQYDGCININSTAEEFRPEIVQSNVTLAHIRRSDNQTQYMFTVVGKDENNFTLVWSNQKRFNNLRFEFDTLIDIPELPQRPNYVHDAKIGIVASSIEASVSKIPRDGGVNRYIASNKTYNCETGISEDNPAVEKDTCEINDENFATLIEHGDILLLKFRSRSGGFQKLVNIDNQGQSYETKHYNGLYGKENLEFRFDFVAPEHCSLASGSCLSKPLHIDNEFTSSTIKARWSGWTDSMSGIWQYYMEVFKLAPNRDERLEEATPIDPVFNRILNYTGGEISISYTPAEPGMYSVLLKVSDMANNSRTARRFVLYDDTSEISVSNESDKKLYISSAVEETGYTWQTPSAEEDNMVTVNVRWDGHFANKLHEGGKFLAEIEKFPVQFKDIEDDGILMSLKFVADALDDDEGERTRKAIPNYHGIIRFEVAYEQSASEEVPTTGWSNITLQERISTKRILEDGDRLRVWIRATDVMGKTKSDSTLVRIDGSPPTISSVNSSGHRIALNVNGGAYKYSSRANFLASDRQSGVHKIEIRLTVKSPGKNDMVTYNNFTEARRGNDNSDPRCIGFDQNGVCLLPTQIVDIDNCWLTVSKKDLETASGELEIVAYNQAMLTATTTFDVGPLTNLLGLEKYNGPTNMRIENKSPTGFRLAWDLPESESCYGAADIVIILTNRDLNGKPEIRSFVTPSTSTYFDFLGLNPEVEYNLGLQIKAEGGTAQAFGQDLSVVTPKKESAGGVSTGAVVGIIIGIIVLCALVVIVLFFLTRRGIIDVQPQRRMGEIRRAVTKRLRQSRMFAPETTRLSYENKTYDVRFFTYLIIRKFSTISVASEKGKYITKTNMNTTITLIYIHHFQDELYLYGGMDFNSSNKGYISRDQITFEMLLKSGHFANIYQARYNGQNVVAKTLKELFTKDDELLMKAKINFSSDRVGDHPNIIKFVGAVVDDVTMGPMIINEFCENGTLRDYLENNKHKMTVEMQENLFRFGLDIAKGMEFLATRGVTHRRLAARNILLNFLNEVKIAGFGPQTFAEEDGGDSESGKKERIPIKWMAPECMTSTKKANERSDVWSYAVVIWEIFSLGETPYTGKSRDLPQRLKRGERLGKPELCDETWYKVMQHCWEYDPKKRPRFEEVREQLDTLFVISPGDDFYYYKR
ncbi:uncharacterized protein LOC128236139 [Mya arenaria]|uniref:uncharacterized protein LOC128236139 n=1 Tax=Mya arenaria TaxID=6604 RepID=UPI0022E8162B|nr:uncharacterized protein LOC128236139 [Mya arenaria]